MKILIINCGSSSVKYELFDVKKECSVARGIVEKIKKKSGYAKAVKIIEKRLTAPRKGVIKCTTEIKGIGHRVVHGGEDFKKSIIITNDVIEGIKKYNKIAPLHNPPALAGIRASLRNFPGIPQVAVFDTSFHHTMPDYSYIYGIPYYLYTKHGVRRYGFHGTSHRYVAFKAAKILKRPLNKLKIITAHLGNGCSMAAILNGKSVDTTMGLTPLEGLLMGTRCGDLDPAIVSFLAEEKKWSPNYVDNVLNKKSGLLGVSGISNDMRDILSEMKKGNDRARLAFTIFVYRIKKYIGAYAAAMGGLDAVIFTAGIGENVPAIKNMIAKDLKPVFRKKVKFLIIPTNEELLIAWDTYKLIKRI